MTDQSILDPERDDRRLKPGTKEGAAKALKARQEAKAAWPPVKQPGFEADRLYLKSILAARGITHVDEAEPATVKRLARLIRRAGFTVGQIEKEVVGCRLDRLIGINPGHALWWLAATTLEAAGVKPARAEPDPGQPGP